MIGRKIRFGDCAGCSLGTLYDFTSSRSHPPMSRAIVSRPAFRHEKPLSGHFRYGNTNNYYFLWWRGASRLLWFIRLETIRLILFNGLRSITRRAKISPMNSLWLVIGSLAAFAVAYRFYATFLATKVAMLDDHRLTPAHRLKDGVDYHPTSRLVLFGHHFAAIAGPGPLVGPVLAAQWGYAPGFIWIVIGACLAGAVHDFVILLASVRQDGLSLPKIARTNIGPLSGITTSIATMFIIITILASIGIVVVNALSESAWGMFTIVVTIPAALATGLWMYKIRPGKVAEASVIGVTIVMLGVFLGKPFADSGLSHWLLFHKSTLALMLPMYAFVASILPVWVLMCPRDYLSSYMKIGVMLVLAVGIFVAHPTLQMPATTPFLNGGPVVSGAVWPFVCIVIMCGALSGFHALIASGTTPKMLYRESDIKPIAFGAMVLEGFVAVTALIAACALQPGDYFAINVAQDKPAQKSAYVQMVQTAQTDHGW